jgi:hypothetical protein
VAPPSDANVDALLGEIFQGSGAIHREVLLLGGLPSTGASGWLD